jgi:predicted dehydrogenase
MKVLIAGFGSIGSRHLKNMFAIDRQCNVVIWHQRSKPTAVIDDLSSTVQRVYSLQEALDVRPDAALITGPASTHIDTGLALAENDIHLFIEKPLSNRIDGVDNFVNECRARGLVLMVGYNFRFYKPMLTIEKALQQQKIGRVLSVRAEAGQYLPDWRPARDYRQTVSARRNLGGGVLLELSHEFDYLVWLLGDVETVWAHADRLSDLDVDVEDIAEVILQFRSGAVGSLHLDMVQRTATRTCRIIGTEGTITWDWDTHRVRMYSAVMDNWTDLRPAERIDPNDMYLAELKHFFGCVAGRATPVVDGEAGRRVLQIALAARRSSKEKRAVKP